MNDKSHEDLFNEIAADPEASQLAADIYELAVSQFRAKRDKEEVTRRLIEKHKQQDGTVVHYMGVPVDKSWPTEALLGLAADLYERHIKLETELNERRRRL